MKRKSKTNLIFHPILISLYPFLFFYSINQAELSIRILQTPVTITVVVVTLVWFLLAKLLSSIQKAAIITSTVSLLFFSYGHIVGLLSTISIPMGDLTLDPHKLLFSVMLIALVIISRHLIKTQSNLARPNVFLNIFSATLVLLQLGNISFRERALSITNKPLASTQIATHKRDVYYIVLDSYPRQDTLEEIYDFNNDTFIRNLEDLGFNISLKATSNYAHTFFSLASSLNSEYINHYINDPSLSPINQLFFQELIHRNQAASFLKSQDYQVINFASGWGPTDELEIADVNYTNPQSISLFDKKMSINEFYIAFLQTTVLSRYITDSLADQARAKIIYAFEKLTDIPYMRGEKFVIAHFNSPHPPYLFDQEGNPIPNAVLKLTSDEFKDKRSYLSQLQFINTQTIDTLKKIIDASEPPPIIILLSDHGTASILGSPSDWAFPTDPNGIKERMNILLATYTPESPELFAQDTTPVNIFTILFNKYFNTSLEVLPNSNYFSTTKDLFTLHNVTEQIAR